MDLLHRWNISDNATARVIREVTWAVLRPHMVRLSAL